MGEPKETCECVVDKTHGCDGAITSAPGNRAVAKTIAIRGLPGPGGLLELVEHPVDRLVARPVLRGPGDHARRVFVVELQRVGHLVRIAAQQLSKYDDENRITDGQSVFWFGSLRPGVPLGPERHQSSHQGRVQR